MLLVFAIINIWVGLGWVGMGWSWVWRGYSLDCYILMIGGIGMGGNMVGRMGMGRNMID